MKEMVCARGEGFPCVIEGVSERIDDKRRVAGLVSRRYARSHERWLIAIRTRDASFFPFLSAGDAGLCVRVYAYVARALYGENER